MNGGFFLRLYVWFYRSTGGKIGGRVGKFEVLLLTTKGRKTGRILTTPLGYFEREGGYFIVASNSGSDKNPGWYYNIQGNPNDVSIEVMNGRKQKVTPEIILGERRKPIYAWIASIAPNYGEYEKRTSREIPLVFLKPQ